ncbi:hypothetical protein F52700_4491 [Fusarium sp. NRRL 52700]|nr:hypothetical protein F52700_4491 [Fusarium sp. NRRL 52700]
MEAVGATASILTFVTVAFSATKSIYGTLSAIKDGPEILGSVNNEISQLQNILQRLLQVVSSTARPTDRAKLEQMVKNCRDDLVGFEVKLRQLDVLGADGRRGQLWRKLKICFEEKDLDRMRLSVERHVQLLTLYLGTIQDQQSSFIATQSTDILAHIQQLKQTSSTVTQSTEILNRIEDLQQTLPSATQLNEVLVSLQQLQQDIAVLQVSSKSVQTKIGPPTISSRVVELDDKNTPISQQTTLDNTIARLMRLLEKKPSIMEFDDAQEIFDDLERLLQSVQDDAQSTKAGKDGQGTDADVSKEMKLFTSLIFSAQSLRVNQTEPMNSFKATEPGVGILQQRKRKEMETSDNVFTVITTKRRSKLLPTSQQAPYSELGGWGFLGNLTVKSKKKKKMITVSVNRDQLLFDRFTSMLPRVIVSQVLPNNSHVFQVASQGSVQDLMRLIVNNKASLHDHDENGWSLLHLIILLHTKHAVGNLAMLRFLIDAGLDVDEVSKDDRQSHSSQTPFVLPGSPDQGDELIYSFCHAWAESLEEGINPKQERQTLDLLISHGYSLQTLNGGQNGLHGFFSNKTKSFSRVLERRDLLTYLISRGTNPCAADFMGRTPSYLAYGSMCKPCSMSQSSLMGDLWDTVLDICGYNISWFRRNYPRKASYKNGYTRAIFEDLWRGREERCPYWNDEPWPEFSNEEVESAFELTLGQGLCTNCSLCFSDFQNRPCGDCGICLLVFQYSCTKKFEVDHEHNTRCPRARVGYFERFENDGQYSFRPKHYSNMDSDDEESDYDNTSSSSGEFEDEQSLSDQTATTGWGHNFEEIISEDESLGGVSL